MTEKPDIKELAIASWRLEKWLENLNSDRKMAAKSALRSIKKYISASGIEVVDPIGSKFDPGLAVEVINNEAEGANEDELIIIETVAPYVYQDGKLVQYARVIIGTDVKAVKSNNTKAEESSDPVDGSPLKILDQNACPTESNEHVLEGTSKDAAVADDGENEEITIGEEEIERIMKYAKIL